MTAPENPSDSDPGHGTAAADSGAETEYAPELRSPLAFLGLRGRAKALVDWLAVAVAVWVLITAVSAIGSGFKLAAGDQAAELFKFAENPLIGLMIGLLATALTQSSSTTTAITVGLVAGGLPIHIAIPILFGANVGTTMTSTLVSLGMARDKEVFRKAFAAASVHDMFNLLAVLIFFPLEYFTGLLEKLSGWMAAQTGGEDPGIIGVIFEGLGDAVAVVTKPGADFLKWAVSPLPDVWAGITLILIGIVFILSVINFIGNMLKSLLVGRAEQIFHAAIGRGTFTGIVSGLLITVMVQSSSTTTSLAVPLAATGKFSLKQIFAFVVGGNIGTTITALIAAFAFSGNEGEAAMQAAFVHLMYNVLAALVIMGIPGVRELPLLGAQKLANLGAENKVYVVAWVLGVFLILPAVLILISIIL